MQLEEPPVTGGELFVGFQGQRIEKPSFVLTGTGRSSFLKQVGHAYFPGGTGRSDTFDYTCLPKK